MRKLIAVILTVLLVASLGIAAFAEDLEGDGAIGTDTSVVDTQPLGDAAEEPIGSAPVTDGGAGDATSENTPASTFIVVGVAVIVVIWGVVASVNSNKKRG